MRRWTLKDRYGNTIYFTEERWLHILESRPWLEPFFDFFLETIRKGHRHQDPLLPNSYQYYYKFDELLPENTHIIVVVIFRKQLNETGAYISNNFVVTGWANYLWSGD